MTRPCYNRLTISSEEAFCGMCDCLVVGSGLTGAVFAHEAAACGKKCLVLEKRGHIGGNV